MSVCPACENSPLDMHHYQQIVVALNNCNGIEESIARAKAIGMDVSAMEQQLLQCRTSLRTMENTYFKR